MQRIKLVVVGDKATEKTKLLNAYTNPYAEGDAVLDHSSYNAMLDGRLIDLDIWDTTGQEDQDQDSWRHLAYSQAQVFVILFSITNSTTFQNVIDKWLPDIVQYAPNTPILLVGNHMEMRGNTDYIESALFDKTFPISHSKGKALARVMNAVDYLECSINNMVGITQVFETAMRASLASKPAIPSKGFLETINKLRTNAQDCQPKFILEILEELTGQTNDISYCHLLMHIGLDYANVPDRTWEAIDNYVWLSLIQSTNNRPLDLNEVPEDLPERLPNLEILDISHNLIESLPASLAELKELNAIGNPLSTIPPNYRSKDKIVSYLKMLHGPLQPWNRIKLMLVGQEGVGKTTLLRALQSDKYDCLTNISTNGINISTIHLSQDSLRSIFGKKEASICCDVWDFGGQTVFHSTHRFFMTSNALYMILYDMTKPESCERLKYWIEQIGSINESARSKPIILVGTHGDCLSKQERQIMETEMIRSFAQKIRNQVEGHYTISLTKKTGLNELKAKIIDIALTHPKIGIGKAMIPTRFMLLQRELERRKVKTPYISWNEYISLATTLGIQEDSLQDLTILLHDTGQIVWHNVPKLRDMVVLNPQWLADALASIVSFIFSATVAKTAGMVSWGKICESLKLKFDLVLGETIVSMLEYFEIIYRIRGMGSKIDDELSDSQMFFVPSLLSPFIQGTKHPGLTHYGKMIPRGTFIRRFIWRTFPAGFVPRLLLRVVHLRLQPLACWLDAAVIMGRTGDECAFLELVQEEDNNFCLEITVKVEGRTRANEEPLISELAYLVMRLHKDTTPPDTPIVHAVVLMRGLSELIISYEDCIRAETQGKKFIEIGGQLEKISEIVVDMTGFNQIPLQNLTLDEQLAEGGFGVVFKGRLKIKDQDGDSFTEVPVAVKQIKDNPYESNFQVESHDFQHEIYIMSKLEHINLVQLLGITLSPLQMVLEYVPHSNLHEIQREGVALTLKWKIKFAIDCACGVEYLHSQTPAICHSDLRAPNIFINSMDEEADVVAKVADFGLSQQIFSFAKQQLYNITETAPETWYGGAYNEKSDVYSYAVILWRLFGSWKQQHSNILRDTNSSISLSLSKVASKLGHTPSSPPMPISDSSQDDDPEFNFLKKKNGQDLPPPVQRELIRKGGRPTIHESCPEPIRELIEQCWQTTPDTRPSFTTVKEQLLDYYESLFGDDDYLESKTISETNVFETPIYDPNNPSLSIVQVFDPHKWSCRNLSDGNATYFLELQREIWIATSQGAIEVFDKETHEKKRVVKLASSAAAGLNTRKMTPLLVRDNCVWVPVGNYIHVISTKTKEHITAPLSNTFPITCMILIPKTNAVWVADTHGNITIWDSQTMLQCYQFKIHSIYCVQNMVLLNNYVWMAVGRDLLVVDTRTLLRALADLSHSDRIQHLLAVPQTNQVWTFTRDGSVSIWKVSDINSVSVPSTPISPYKPPTPTFQSISSGLATVRSSFHLSPIMRTRAATLATSHSYSKPRSIIPSSSPPVPIHHPPPPEPSSPTTRRRDRHSGVFALTNLALNIPEKTEGESFNTDGANFVVKRKYKSEREASPLKYACLMSDGTHVCTGSFQGELVLWNIFTKERQQISIPEDMKDKSIMCLGDCQKGLWCGIESDKNVVMFHPHEIFVKSMNQF